MNTVLRNVALAGWVLLSGATTVSAEPTTVIVVRHAERMSDPSDDPALSAKGQNRAAALATLLADYKIRSIITTQFRRARDTAAPTAAARGVTPRVIAAGRGSGDGHVQEVLAAIAKADGAVLVVGHSNTVPQIVEGLAGEAVAPVCESSFATLFVVDGKPGSRSVQRLSYGEPDRTPAGGCS